MDVQLTNLQQMFDVVKQFNMDQTLCSEGKRGPILEASIMNGWMVNVYVVGSPICWSEYYYRNNVEFFMRKTKYFPFVTAPPAGPRHQLFLNDASAL